MKLKKIICYLVLIVASFSFYSSVNALCYEKCTDGIDCYYVRACMKTDKISCTIVDDSYCNVEYDSIDKESVVSCGGGYMDNIPSLIPKVISIAYTVLQITVPVVLVIMGSMDLFKGITAQKEDEIKKGQQMFIKRLISASIIFFVFVIVKVLISVVADSSGNKILECTECFIEGNCD